MESVPPAASAPLRAAAIAELVGGVLDGDPELEIQGVAALDGAGPTDAAFALPAHAEAARRSRAGLLLTTPEIAIPGRAVVHVENPPLAAARLAQRLHPRSRPAPGVHPSAVVAESARLGAGVSVGPLCSVGEDCELGPGVVLGAGVHLGARVRLGEDCYLHPGVVVYDGVSLGRACTVHANATLGSDGFGYVWDGREHVKVPQLGTLEIGDAVEIGAATCIDRGTFGATRIGNGCILDNLVQVGHNCVLEDFVVLCGQVGLSGSTWIGSGALMAGRSASGGHLRIGAGAQVAGGAGVTRDVAPGSKVGGLPAWDLRSEMRAQIWLRRMVRRERRARRARRDRDAGDSGGAQAPVHLEQVLAVPRRGE